MGFIDCLRVCFIVRHQEGVAFDVSRQDGSEFPCDFIFSGHGDHLRFNMLRFKYEDDCASWRKVRTGRVRIRAE